MEHRAVVVVAGGGPPAPDRLPAVGLPEGAPVVAADSGVDTALALGMHVDVVVGDLDSATPEGLANAEAAGARIERHPVAKDETDLALALAEADAVLGGSGGEVIVVAGADGRLDHLLGGILAVADRRWAHLRVRGLFGDAVVHVLHGPDRLELPAEPGALVTLLPVGGAACGVRTRGLRFPLDGDDLHPGTTRGVSNVVDVAAPVVVLEGGTLLAILPGGH